LRSEPLPKALERYGDFSPTLLRDEGRLQSGRGETVLRHPLLCTAALLVFVTAGAWAGCAPDYRFDKNSGVFIQDFIVNGTTSLDSGDLQKIRGKLIGACVDEQTDDLEQLVKGLFQNEGYYAAVVHNFDIRTIDPLAHPKTISLETEIVEGPIFKFGQVNFVGNHAFTTAELRNALSLRKGEVAKRSSIGSGFDGIRKLYLPNGFGDLTFIPDDTNDLGNFTVNMTLTVVEGPQYHMGKLIVVGKHNDLSTRLQTLWSIPEGAVFDFGYPEEYIKANRTLLPKAFSKNDLQIVRDCPEATVAVWLILDEPALLSQSQPRAVKCEESHDKDQ